MHQEERTNGPKNHTRRPRRPAIDHVGYPCRLQPFVYARYARRSAIDQIAGKELRALGFDPAVVSKYVRQLARRAYRSGVQDPVWYANTFMQSFWQAIADLLPTVLEIAQRPAATATDK